MAAREDAQPAATERDTVVALSSAPGRGAIAVVRLTGPGSEAVAGRVFQPREGAKRLLNRRLFLGRFVGAGGEVLDEGMAVLMRKPRSFTGEDMAEFYCHGGPAVVEAILQAAADAGARPAAPGEFTRRAFLEGKIDLIQAESVADLISAETGRAARAALALMDRGLSEKLEDAWERIVEAGAHLEAAIDFPDEFEPGAGPSLTGAPMDGEELGERLRRIEENLFALEQSYRTGRMLREGARVAILGRPNAGKSTLLNCLLGTDRAIMSPIPGTTRDTVEETCDVEGIPIRLIDTAGLRETGDLVEIEGAARARLAAQGADLCLVIFDAAGGPEERAWAAGECGRLEAPSLLVANKIDLPEARFPTELAASGNGGNSLPYEGFCQISALRNEGVDALRRAMAGALAGEAGEAGAGGQALLTRERHRDLVAKCRKAAGRAGDALFSGESPELVAVHLNEAQAALSSLLGRDYGEALLDRIFSEFCIGK